ncbi:MAG: FkbM family methyltransferase [Anaerolineales bacterium]
MIFIYGTGTVGQEIWKLLKVKGYSIKGFIDHSLTQRPLPEAFIFQPDDERIPIKDRRNSDVIMAIHNRAAQIPPIIENLHRLGYGQIITLIDLYDNFANELGQRYWLTSRNFYSNYEKEILLTQNLFEDKASRELFRSLISFRKTGDYSILSAPDMEHQYFPSDIPFSKKPIRFVDCGAFDGDTLRNFVESKIPIEALAAFEPDQINFQKLSKYIRESQIPNAFLWPCGVYSSSTQIRFDSGQGEASVISEKGAFTIQCISLDDAIPNFNPTLIKMDIEGAEIEALRGAQHIIQKYRPELAISVYHLPSHIWEIPLFVKAMMPDTYHYYLRAHGFNDFDIVLYTIPI